jgi:hypothetical protein
MRGRLAIYMILAIVLGIMFRLEPFIEWRANPHKIFYEEKPLLTCVDGYYYLRYARDLTESAYRPIDELRAVPQNPMRPQPPPLLSEIIAWVAKSTTAPLEWIAALFPAGFGVLLFFPLYFIGRFWCNSWSGIIAGVIGVTCCPLYLHHTSMGWLDTDCGNVTFTMVAVWLSIRASTEQRWKKYIFMLGAILNCFLFLLWWDMVPHVVVGICLSSWLLAYVFSPAPKKEHLVDFSMGLISIATFTCFWGGFDFWSSFPETVSGLFRYVSKSELSDFPSVAITVSEQTHLPFTEIVKTSSGNWYILLTAVVGIVLLFVKSPRKGMQIGVPIGLGTLSFFYSVRFALFMAPIIALGSANLFHYQAQLAMRRPLRFLPSALFFCTCVFLPLNIGASIVALHRSGTDWPLQSPNAVQGLNVAGQNTPANSVIWASWDLGHPLMYWSRRASIGDGAFHGGELSMINAFALASRDPRLSANWMHFYVARGLEGFHRVYDKLGGTAEGMETIQRILSAGIEDASRILEEKDLSPTNEWLAFFFPPCDQRRPIYLFLDERLLTTNYWWYWQGTWDVRMHGGSHPILRSFRDVERDGHLLAGSPFFLIDLNFGLFTSKEMAVPLAKIAYRKGGEWAVDNYRDVGMIFEYDIATGWGILSSADIHESVFHQLFFLDPTENPYFEPVLEQKGSHQLWEVHGDSVEDLSK